MGALPSHQTNVQKSIKFAVQLSTQFQFCMKLEVISMHTQELKTFLIVTFRSQNYKFLDAIARALEFVETHVAFHHYRRLCRHLKSHSP
jgi:hypothetical protein